MLKKDADIYQLKSYKFSLLDISLIFSGIITLLISFFIWNNWYSFILYVAWIISIAAIFATHFFWKKLYIISRNNWIQLLIYGLVIFIPLIVRIYYYDLTRIHGDDMITGYISAKLAFTSDNLFSGFPRDPVDWVARFPSAFFVLQWFFLKIFGTNLLTIKLSVLPYVAITSLTTYLITKRLSDQITALTSVIFLSFFSASVYLETLGLHFISSTSLYMLLLYFLFHWWYKPTLFRTVLVGITCGFCYLFYITSYIALPIVLISILFVFSIKHIDLKKQLIYLSFGFFIVILPYITYALKYDNYFFSRINQVSMLTGSWSDSSLQKMSPNAAINKLLQHSKKSLQSFILPGIGGGGGYNFGKMALFDRLTLTLFIIGFLYFLISSYKKPQFVLLIFSLVGAIITMVLSIPPPGFHRVSLAFPIIAIACAFPIYILKNIFKNSSFALLIFLPIVFLFVQQHQQRISKMIYSESKNPNIKLSDYLNKYYPNCPLFIASFPGYNFEKIYYFSANKPKNRYVLTDYHHNFLQSFDASKHYLYVMIFPSEYIPKFQLLDPKGTTIPFSSVYSIFVDYDACLLKNKMK